MRFLIFNRWGQMVFIGNGKDSWDGTYNGKIVPQGVYAYNVQIVNMHGDLQSFSGSLTVLR
jgi:gliding motility-associated-like protein